MAAAADNTLQRGTLNNTLQRGTLV